jgi:hexosaminidase
MIKKISFVLAICVWLVNAHAQVLPLIPQPNKVELQKGSFTINKNTIIFAEKNSDEAAYLQQYILENYGLKLKVTHKIKYETNLITFLKATEKACENNKEEYQLNVTTNSIKIFATTNTGIFYGIQTLIQLLPIEKNNQLTIACLQINDAPRYQWRGMHLDCSRHFFTKQEVKKYIDYLAMYKLNVFHWHLVDDQGWRIEIKKYPLLTQIGSKRSATLIGKPTFDANGNPSPNDKYDSTLYQGFYTQQDVKEIVAYAKKRHITVIPEIEMPGHSLAALAAYPQFACNPGPFQTFSRWGVSDDVYCAGNDETFTFLENILTEVMQLFPSKYIHIGGDECVKTKWKACPKCQKRKADEHLEDEEALQSYFITRIEKFVNANGRQIIGWDEILEGGLAPNAAVMSWRGINGGIAAAKQKHFVVMSPGRPCYFDHYQSRAKDKEPVAIGGFNPLDSVYNYNPTPDSLNADEQKYIMGAQANVWTEYITTFSHVEYMSLPRMSALSEVLWTNTENKNYQSFMDRLKLHSAILDRMKANYAKHFNTNN